MSWARKTLRSFHITDHIKRGLILLDRKAFESTLVNMPGAGGVAMGVQALAVSEREPAKKLGHLAVFLRPRTMCQ